MTHRPDHPRRRSGAASNMASSYILNLDVLSERQTVVDQLQQALDSRVVIEQAKGIVAGQRGISTEEAFELRRTHARSTNTKLHDVCRRVVAGTDIVRTP